MPLLECFSDIGVSMLNRIGCQPVIQHFMCIIVLNLLGSDFC